MNATEVAPVFDPLQAHTEQVGNVLTGSLITWSKFPVGVIFSKPGKQIGWLREIVTGDAPALDPAHAKAASLAQTDGDLARFESMKGESEHLFHLLLIVTATEQQFHAEREGCARFEKLKVVLVAAQNAIINVDFRSARYRGSSRVDLQACKLGTGRRFTTS
jgi:hypothetical protein